MEDRQSMMPGQRASDLTQKDSGGVQRIPGRHHAGFYGLADIAAGQRDARAPKEEHSVSLLQTFFKL